MYKGRGRLSRSDVDPPPPSRRAGCQRRVRPSLVFLQTPDPQTDPALPADLHPKSPLPAPQTPNVEFLADFLPIENPSLI